MKKLDRVDIQVSILTFLLVVVSCFSIFFINYRLSYNAMIDELQNRVSGIYAFLETKLDERTIASINTKEDMETEIYRETKKILDDVRLTTGVRYLYTAKITEAGEYIYLVDGLPYDSGDFRNAGDPLEEEIIPDIKRALAGEVVMPEKIKDTSWGHIFISYFPIHEGDQIIGVIGIEFDARMQDETYRKLKIITPLIIILFCIIASLIAVKMFRRISNPAYRDFANTDMLTGFANRNAFAVMMNNEDTRKRMVKKAFISVDFDGLKQINDSMGHEKGDEYLKTGTSLIRDAVGKKGNLYRVGGDEFVIVLSGEECHNLRVLIKQIEEKLKEYNKTAEMKVQFSIGSAIFDEKLDHTLSDTLKRADIKMYECKKYKKKASNYEKGIEEK